MASDPRRTLVLSTEERKPYTPVFGVGAFEKEVRLPRYQLVAAAVVGYLVLLLLLHVKFSAFSEYPAIYDGARLVGTPYLYDTSHNQQEQIRAIGGYGAYLSFVRLPFYAAILWPLGRLPYHTSVFVWEACSAIALSVFVFLWPINGRAFTAAVCAWSFPVLMTFAFAEDDLWLLVIIAVLFRWRDVRPTTCGVIASLLSIKFHLFLLFPLLLIGQRRWEMMRGFLIGCFVLISVSFAVGGLTWPIELSHLLSTKAILPNEYAMPNLRGLLSGVTDQIAPELFLDILVAAVVFRILRRASFEIGMAATLVGSLLVSHHAGPEDCVVLIPALLVLGETGRPVIVLFCLLLLSPICYMFFSFGGCVSAAGVLGISSILAVLYWQRAFVPAGSCRRPASTSC